MLRLRSGICARPNTVRLKRSSKRVSFTRKGREYRRTTRQQRNGIPKLCSRSVRGGRTLFWDQRNSNLVRCMSGVLEYRKARTRLSSGTPRRVTTAIGRPSRPSGLLSSELSGSRDCAASHSQSGSAPRGLAHHLHFVPVVGKFLSAIQADHVGSGERGRRAAPLRALDGKGKAASLVRTTEDTVKQAHKPPPSPPHVRTLFQLFVTVIFRGYSGPRSGRFNTVTILCRALSEMHGGEPLLSPREWQSRAKPVRHVQAQQRKSSR